MVSEGVHRAGNARGSDSVTAETHQCNITFRVPVRTESGREVASTKTDAVEVTFTDEQLRSGMVVTGAISLKVDGRAFELPFELPLAELDGMESVTAALSGLTLHPERSIEAVRDANGTLMVRHYRPVVVP